MALLGLYPQVYVQWTAASALLIPQGLQKTRRDGYYPKRTGISQGTHHGKKCNTVKESINSLDTESKVMEEMATKELKTVEPKET